MTLQQLPRPHKHFRIGEKSSIETKLKPCSSNQEPHPNKGKHPHNNIPQFDTSEVSSLARAHNGKTPFIDANKPNVERGKSPKLGAQAHTEDAVLPVASNS